MCDLLWSDPEGIDIWNVKYNFLDNIDDYEKNPRGAGVVFGSKLVEKFCRLNGLDRIVRAHQLIMEGYK